MELATSWIEKKVSAAACFNVSRYFLVLFNSFYTVEPFCLGKIGLTLFYLNIACYLSIWRCFIYWSFILMKMKEISPCFLCLLVIYMLTPLTFWKNSGFHSTRRSKISSVQVMIFSHIENFSLNDRNRAKIFNSKRLWNWNSKVCSWKALARNKFPW